jgi:predicted esterase
VTWRAYDQWRRWSLLAHDALHGIGGDDHALMGEDVSQSLLPEAGVLCLGTPYSINYGDKLAYTYDPP